MPEKSEVSAAASAMGKRSWEKTTDPAERSARTLVARTNSIASRRRAAAARRAAKQDNPDVA